MPTIIMLLGALLIGTAGFAGFVLVGMHERWSPAVEFMRRLTMILNRRQSGAGQPGAYAGIMRHVGRTSGTLHETPLGIEPTEDGFVITIVYGRRSSWVRNVLAAGSAEITVEGQTYQVDRPEIVPLSEVSHYFKPSDQHMTSLFGVQECLRLYHAEHD